MDFKIVYKTDANNPDLFDLELVDGQFVLCGEDQSNENDYTNSVKQRVLHKLVTFKGEWYLDQRDGFPWMQKVFGKNGIALGEAKIANLFRNVVLDTKGVKSVEEVTISIDRQYRLIDIYISGTTDIGTVFDISEIDVPNIVRDR